MTDEAPAGCVELPAELTIETCEPVLAAVRGKCHGPVDLRFDCSKLQVIDVVGLQLLVAATNHFRAQGKECRFEAVSSCLDRTLSLSGCQELVQAR